MSAASALAILGKPSQVQMSLCADFTAVRQQSPAFGLLALCSC